MELMDSSMDKISEKVYNQLQQRIPEEILGKMTVAVSDDDPLPCSLVQTCMCNDPLPTRKMYSHACTYMYSCILCVQVIKALNYLKSELSIIHRGKQIGF